MKRTYNEIALDYLKEELLDMPAQELKEIHAEIVRDAIVPTWAKDTGVPEEELVKFFMYMDEHRYIVATNYHTSDKDMMVCTCLERLAFLDTEITNYGDVNVVCTKCNIEEEEDEK